VQDISRGSGALMQAEPGTPLAVLPEDLTNPEAMQKAMQLRWGALLGDANTPDLAKAIIAYCKANPTHGLEEAIFALAKTEKWGKVLTAKGFGSKAK